MLRCIMQVNLEEAYGGILPGFGSRRVIRRRSQISEHVGQGDSNGGQSGSRSRFANNFYEPTSGSDSGGRGNGGDSGGGNSVVSPQGFGGLDFPRDTNPASAI